MYIQLDRKKKGWWKERWRERKKEETE